MRRSSNARAASIAPLLPMLKVAPRELCYRHGALWAALMHARRAHGHGTRTWHTDNTDTDMGNMGMDNMGMGVLMAPQARGAIQWGGLLGQPPAVAVALATSKRTGNVDWRYGLEFGLGGRLRAGNVRRSVGFASERWRKETKRHKNIPPVFAFHKRNAVTCL